MDTHSKLLIWAIVVSSLVTIFWFSVSGCPKNEANYVKTGKYIPRSPAMTAKKSVSVFTTAATRMVDNSTAAAKSGIVSTRSSAK